MPVKPLPPEDLAHVLTHTRELWAEANGKSFFITGGTGFFGMWLLESFTHINDALSLGMSATVLTRDPSAFALNAPHLTSRADLRFVAGDVRSFAVPVGRFDYVIHAATEASAKLNDETPHKMLDAILGGTRRVLDFAAQGGVKKLLFTSSGAVYGKQPFEITHVSEDYLSPPDPLLPGSAYGEGKRVSEQMCVVHARRHGYEVKIARCFAFVGPHLPLDGHFAVGNFMRDALAGKLIQIAGDGSPLRSYLFASDLAIWLWTILFRAASCRAYNVGSDALQSIVDIAHKVLAAGNGTAVVIAKAATPNVQPSSYVPEVKRAMKALGLKTEVNVMSAIIKTFDWLKSTEITKLYNSKCILYEI
jgi:nucleoside-diphosphate-sugar epimerase